MFEKFISGQNFRLISIFLVAVLGLLVVAFGIMYKLTPNNFAFPKNDHYHLRLQYVFHGVVEDFGSPRYQVDYVKDICEGKLTEAPIHFHDNKDQIVHLHWQRITGGEFLKFFGVNKIGGFEDMMGWKIDDLLQFPPKLTPIPIHSNSLPKPNKDDNFYLYSGDQANYVEKNFQDFVNQDLETFTGINSLERLDQEKAKEFEQKMKVGFSTIKVEAHEGHSHANDSEAALDEAAVKAKEQELIDSRNNGNDDSLISTTTSTNTTSSVGTTTNPAPKTEEELKQINNLIGNIVIFVQPQKPTDAQIKARFNDLTPLGLSACGG